VRTNESQSNIVQLSAIRREKHRALSPFGPVRAGLTISQSREILRGEQEAQLTELLNSLESAVATLVSKSYTVSDTLTIAIEGARVALSHTTQEAGTDE
jgi:ABC-type transporter Mla subunit MlaD